MDHLALLLAAQLLVTPGLPNAALAADVRDSRPQAYPSSVGDDTGGDDFASLMQLSVAATRNAKASESPAHQHSALLSRAWMEDPVLRRRLAGLVHEHGLDSTLDNSTIRAMLEGPLKSQTDQILQEEVQRWRHEQDAARKSSDLRQQGVERRRQEREFVQKRKDEDQAGRHKEKEATGTEIYEPTGPKDKEGMSDVETHIHAEQEVAQRRKEDDALERRHEENERQRAERERKQRLMEEAAKMLREELREELAAEEAKRASAQSTAEQADAEKRKWQSIAEEAKRKANEQLALEASAEEAMRKAAEEEARWQAAASEAEQKEQQIKGHEVSIEAAVRAEAAQQQAEEKAWKLSEEEEAQHRAAEEARRQVEARARQRAEEEAQQRAEEVDAQRRATEEDARRRAEEEDAQRRAEEETRRRAEEEAQQKAEEEARKRAEEEEKRQKAEKEVWRPAKDEDVLKRAKAAWQKGDVSTWEDARVAAELKAAMDATQAEQEQKIQADLEMLQSDLASRLGEGMEVDSISNSWEQARVCVKPHDLSLNLQESKSRVLQGLPEWHAHEVPSVVPRVIIAFLIQASWEDQLPVLRRAFDRLYARQDLFLYTVDRERMDTQKVTGALPNPLPDNVIVKPSAHSDYYVWPRVEIVLDGLRTLLKHKHKWDFVIHLSESDYPVHNMNWIRQSLAKQRNTNFVQIIPRCQKLDDRGLDFVKDEWYWWSQGDALSSCGSEIEVTQVEGVKFPLDALESRGFRFAHGAEWMVITRELVKYALSPELLHYRKLVGMHIGADEIFWQTLLLNIPKFTQNVSQQGWFLQWGHGKTDHSPDTLTAQHEETIMQSRSKYFFLRKVSMEDSSELLDDLDALANEPDRAPGPVEPSRPGMDWSLNTVACPQPALGGEGAADEDRREAIPVKPPKWQGTKSRKQLVEAYKWYLATQ